MLAPRASLTLRPFEPRWTQDPAVVLVQAFRGEQERARLVALFRAPLKVSDTLRFEHACPWGGLWRRASDLGLNVPLARRGAGQGAGDTCYAAGSDSIM